MPKSMQNSTQNNSQDNTQNQIKIPRDSIQVKLPPKFTLVIHEKKIYGLALVDRSIGSLTLYRVGSKKFAEIFNDYMPAWAAYYSDDFKNVFIKSDFIDYKLDEVAVEGLRLIVEERESFKINDPPREVMRWVYDTLRNL